MLSHISANGFLYEMRPPYHGATKDDEERIYILRTHRRYPHAPPMNLESYVAGIVDRHRHLYWESGIEFGPLRRIVENCTGEKGAPSGVMRVIYPGCLEAMASNQVEAWRAILKAWGAALETECPLECLIYGYAPHLEHLAGRRVSNVSVTASNLWSLSLYSLFLRRLLILPSSDLRGSLPVPQEESSLTAGGVLFDLAGLVRRILGSTPGEGREEVEWLVANYCCYAAPGVYPLLIWYATTFGTELPPGTIRSYLPDLRRRELYLRGEPEYVPTIRTSIEHYGRMAREALERYSRMLDIDSILVAMAIDIFYGRFLKSPWMRSAVLSSFINTLAMIRSGGWPSNSYTVMPALLSKQSVHERVQSIPVPLVIKRMIHADISENMRDMLQQLSEMAMSKERMAEVSSTLMEIMRGEIVREEANIANRLASVTKGLGGCIKGIIVEVLHPIAGYYLVDSVAGRAMAYIPSSALAVNVFFLLMNRLMDADYIEVLVHLVVDTRSLLKSYLQRVGRSIERHIHTIYYRAPGNVKIRVESLNIERIAKEIIKEPDRQGKEDCLGKIWETSLKIQRSLG